MFNKWMKVYSANEGNPIIEIIMIEFLTSHSKAIICIQYFYKSL